MRMWMFLENVGNILAMDDVMQFMIQDCFSKKSSLKLVHTWIWICRTASVVICSCDGLPWLGMIAEQRSASQSNKTLDDSGQPAVLRSGGSDASSWFAGRTFGSSRPNISTKFSLQILQDPHSESVKTCQTKDLIDLISVREWPCSTRRSWRSGRKRNGTLSPVLPWRLGSLQSRESRTSSAWRQWGTLPCRQWRSLPSSCWAMLRGMAREVKSHQLCCQNFN